MEKFFLGFKVSNTELTNLLDSRKGSFETQLHEETCKRRKLEITVQKLTEEKSDQRKLEAEIAALKETNKNYEKITAESRKGYSSIKPWEECTRQQQHNRKKVLAHDIDKALHFCEQKGFKAHSVELQNVNTGNTEVLNISTGTFSDKENLVSTNVSDNKVYSTLYVKDKFCISDQAFHELSSIASDLPKSCQVKKLGQTLNSEFLLQTKF